MLGQEAVAKQRVRQTTAPSAVAAADSGDDLDQNDPAESELFGSSRTLVGG